MSTHILGTRIKRHSITLITVSTKSSPVPDSLVHLSSVRDRVEKRVRIIGCVRLCTCVCVRVCNIFLKSSADPDKGGSHACNLCSLIPAESNTK